MERIARIALSSFAAVVVGGCLAVVPGTAADAAKIRRASSDFNGDGFQDLLLGSPYTTVNGNERAGALTVVYASRSGLDPARRQIITRDSRWIPGSAADGIGFGDRFAAGDFDRDGFADLAVHVSTTIAGVRGAGSVTVLYGSRRGLTAGITIPNPEPRLADPDQFSPTNRGFGDGLTAGNIDGKGPGELVVHAGSSTKGARWVYRWKVGSRRIPAGTKVAAGYPDRNFPHEAQLADMTGDSKADLVTVPAYEPNQLALRPGTATGLGAIRRGPVLNGMIYAHAVGDLNGDGHADLALGMADHGMVVRIIYGAPRGFGRMQAIRPSATPVKFSKTYLWQNFGASLAIGDINGDGRADLAIGDFKAIRRKETGHFMPDGGAVLIMRGSAGGISFRDAQVITQDTNSVPGEMRSSNFFGRQLTFIDYNRDGRADLTGKAYGCDDSPRDSLIVLPGNRSGVLGAGARRINGPTRTCGGSPWATVLLK